MPVRGFLFVPLPDAIVCATLGHRSAGENDARSVRTGDAVVGVHPARGGGRCRSAGHGPAQRQARAGADPAVRRAADRAAGQCRTERPAGH
ncbi:hypothetical protein G6F24_016398 [Rhizopus arrhizus]|nr:hypothetical protein G6F24_016398 [Rhizopus arrhizus]